MRSVVVGLVAAVLAAGLAPAAAFAKDKPAAGIGQGDAKSHQEGMAETPALIQQTGSVARPDLERTLNCGVGMVALTAADDADRALALLAEHDVDAWVAGTVSPATDDDRGVVRLVGDYA